MSLFLSFIISFVSLIQVINSSAVSIFAEWNILNFTWDETHTYQSFVADERFIPENCLLAGINVDITGDIYLTVPRWRNGVPATLNKYNIAQNSLTPYPSWDMQKEGTAGDLQNVQSMTIDSKRRMWVIEVGRRNFFIKSPKMQVPGAAGIWMIDLTTDSIISKYYFPNEIISRDNSFLNDLVVDESRDIAYLTDAWGDGALIAFDLAKQSSRRYTGASTKPDSSYAMVVNGVNYGRLIFTTPTDGIALTDDNEAIFFCQVQGTTLYRLPAALLRNFSTTNAEIDDAVQVLSQKEPSDGMKYVDGTLYFGSLTTSTFYHLPVDAASWPDMTKDAVMEPPSTETMQWVDTFAIDKRASSNPGRRLWFVSNRLDEYSVGTMDFTGARGANMRISTVDMSKLQEQ